MLYPQNTHCHNAESHVRHSQRATTPSAEALSPRIHSPNDAIPLPHDLLPSVHVPEGRDPEAIRLGVALGVVLVPLDADTDVEATVAGLAVRRDGAVLRACVDLAGLQGRVAIFAGALVEGDYPRVSLRGLVRCRRAAMGLAVSVRDCGAVEIKAIAHWWTGSI